MTLAKSADGWNFTARKDKSILARHLSRRADFTLSYCDLKALSECFTSNNHEFKNCVVEYTDEKTFCLKRLLRPGVKRTKLVTEGILMPRLLIDLVLQSLDNIDGYFQEKGNPSMIRVEDYQIDAHQMIETLIAFLAFRLISCQHYHSNSLKDIDCMDIFEQNVEQNALVTLQQIKDVLQTKIGVPPFFPERLSDVFMTFVDLTGIDAYPILAENIFGTMTPERVTELVNCRVLQTGCDELVTYYVRRYIEFELFRECWCFYNLY